MESKPQTFKRPIELLPVMDDQAELQELKNKLGQSRTNELQRSVFYRIKPQVDFLRTQFESLPENEQYRILNIGPANLEEACVLAVLAHRAGKLNQTEIDFIDISTPEMINPEFGLGKNFVEQPIEPPSADRSEYEMKDGIWVVKDEIRNFVDGEVKKPTNHFGTSVENYLRNEEGEKFNLVTFNNIAQYLGRGLNGYDNPIYKREGDFISFQAVILSVAEKVAEGGILLANMDRGTVMDQKISKDALDQYLRKNTNFDEVFETIDARNGIYRRKTSEPLKVF